MNDSLMPAMLLTHVPYLLIAIALLVAVRRTRRTIERAAADLEQVVRRRT